VPEVLLHTPSHDENNGERRYPARHFQRQGVKALTNMEGRFECRACPADYGKIPDFTNTRKRRDHERKFHEQPGGGRTKFKRVGDKMEDAGQKWKEDMIGKLHQATAKQLEEAEKLLRLMEALTDRQP
jgi:hypothetical protein